MKNNKLINEIINSYIFSATGKLQDHLVNSNSDIEEVSKNTLGYQIIVLSRLFISCQNPLCTILISYWQ